LIDGNDLDAAEEVLREIGADDPREWRVRWYEAIAMLARASAEDAVGSFTAVYHALPGELAPKLALAVACESAGELADAARWFDIVSRTDPSITGASFGLARCKAQLGDRAAALQAYERIPDSSSDYLDAQSARIRRLVAEPSLESVLAAGTALETLPIEGEKRDRMTAELLEAALELALDGRAFDDGRAVLLGCRLTERDLRIGLEHSYRALARRAGSRAERIRLVDQANRSRPRTWT
jgi:serine/threonine-protein kinase PknG